MDELVCRYFLTSPTGCRDGQNCFFPHIISANRKPDKICRYFLFGRCAYGYNCWYQHIPLSSLYAAATPVSVRPLLQSISTSVHANYQHCTNVLESGTYSSTAFPNPLHVNNLSEPSNNLIPPVVGHGSIQELPNFAIPPPQVPLSNPIQLPVYNYPVNYLQTPQAICAWNIVSFVWELPGIVPERIQRNATFNNEEQYENDSDSATSTRSTSKTSKSSATEISSSYQNEDNDFTDSIDEGNFTGNDSNAVRSQASLGSQSAESENNSSVFQDNTPRQIPVITYYAGQNHFFSIAQPVVVINASSQMAAESGVYTAYGSEINYLPLQPEPYFEFSNNNLGNPNMVDWSGENIPVANLEVNRSNSASEGYPINLRTPHDNKFTDQSSSDFDFISETTNGNFTTLIVGNNASKETNSLNPYLSEENGDHEKNIDETNDISGKSEDGLGINGITPVEFNVERFQCPTTFNKDSENPKDPEEACSKMKIDDDHTYKEPVDVTREKFELIRSDNNLFNTTCDIKYKSKTYSNRSNVIEREIIQSGRNKNWSHSISDSINGTSQDPASEERSSYAQNWPSLLKTQYQMRQKDSKHTEKETLKDLMEPLKPLDRPKHSAEDFSMPAAILSTESLKLSPPSQSDTKVHEAIDTVLLKKRNYGNAAYNKHKLTYLPSGAARHFESVSSNCEEAASFENRNEIKCPICSITIKFRGEKSDIVFGILENCNHVHCVNCLRIRKAKERSRTQRDEVSCPQCNKTSRFIIPVDTVIRSVDEKNQIVDRYKKMLKKKTCRYFRSKWGSCTRGDTCPYLHPGTNDAFRNRYV